MGINMILFVSLILVLLLGTSGAQEDGWAEELKELRKHPWGVPLGNISSFEIESRIHGGKATRKIVPYTAVFIENDGGTLYEICTGTYLGDQWTMLAAHCLPLPSTTEVHLGVYDITKHPTFKSGVAGQWEAPTWRLSTLEGDIGLVKMKSKPPPSPNIKPVCLGGYRKMDGVPVTGYGWGLTSCAGLDQRSDVLKQMTGVGSDFCDDYHGPKQTRICAWLKKDGQPDKGDSGGPLVINAGSSRPLQVGVCSRTRYRTDRPGCPDPNKLFEFTRVSEYFSWIKSKYPGVCTEGASFGTGSSSSGKPSGGIYGRPQSPPKHPQGKPQLDFWGRPIKPQAQHPVNPPKPQKPTGTGYGKTKPHPPAAPAKPYSKPSGKPNIANWGFFHPPPGAKRS